MNIRPIHSFYTIKQNHYNNNNKEKFPENNNITLPDFYLRAKFNDHLLSFGAQVDKGLERFYETNKNRMPNTVKRYIEALDDKTRLTPLQVQKRAFMKLNNTQTIKDIQKEFPDEELFFELTEASKTKATRGILMSVKENEELLSLSDQGILKDKSDLTVYLVKKIFLEGKTIDEINKDLENDLDEDFKADFHFKNKDKDSQSKYIYSSTLKALGIKMPAFEYQQSLRYTREGYSDMVGENITRGLRSFWDSLSDNERTARAKKSVENFENWWNGLSDNEKLDMIADQLTTEEMLKAYKKTERAEERLKKQSEKNTENTEKSESKTRKHTKVGSEKLFRDELFKKWAANNLKIYEANLSEAERDTLHLKKMQRLSARWSNMTAEERTDYISKMKAGSEPLRYTMIDAWNHSTSLIKDLSSFLKASQIYKPADLLYSTQEFSQYQSQVMTEFWASHPDHAVKLGQNIIKSQEKINMAISRGTFEELKKEIMRDKNQRIKEIEKFKTEKNTPETKEESSDLPEYVKEFKDAYYTALKPRLKVLPQEYLKDFIDVIAKDMPEKQIKAWTKNLRNEPLSIEEQHTLHEITKTEPASGAKINRAIEAAGAVILYECTKNPEVFLMSHSDVKTALYKLDKGDNPIELGSLKCERDFQIPVLKNKYSSDRLALLYKHFKEPLHELELDDIINKYFDSATTKNPELDAILKNSSVPVSINGFDKNAMKEYLKLYGKSLSILFSEKSAYPKEVKKAFYEKIKTDIPESLTESLKHCYFEHKGAFEKDEKIKQICFLFAKRFDFVPTAFIDSFIKEMAKDLREAETMDMLEYFMREVCTKRKNPNEMHKLAIFPKDSMSTEGQMKMLIVEQALADVLYEATGNTDVYEMSFEELCDNIEIFNLIKKYPTGKRTYVSQTLNKEISISANKKINTFKIQRLSKEYADEIAQWLNEEAHTPEGLKFEDLLYILNPDENMPQKDEAVSRRIKHYNFNLK